MAVGRPDIKTMFYRLVQDVGSKASTGVVLMLLKDSAENGTHILRSIEDMPSGLSEDNKKRVKECFTGGANDESIDGYIEKIALTPERVILRVVANEATTTEELTKLEDTEFNVFCMPGASTEDVTAITAYIDRMNEAGVGCIAVVSDKTVNNSNLVNFKTDVTVNSESITADNFVGRIAGIIAGVPLTQSVTYQILDEVKVATMDKSAADIAINKGELIITNIAGKPRIARGVTSLASSDDTEPFRKIKLRQIAHLINNSIRKLLIDGYLGKVPNTYDNKILLCNDIKTELLDKFSAMGLLEGENYVGIHVANQKAYLRKIGKPVDEMTDDEVRKANTGSHVFLRIRCHEVDAMEDFDIAIGI